MSDLATWLDDEPTNPQLRRAVLVLDGRMDRIEALLRWAVVAAAASAFGGSALGDIVRTLFLP